MDWTRFKETMAAQFVEKTPPGAEGKILTPDSPIDLHELLLAVAETPDHDWLNADASSAPEGEAWPADALEALQRQWACRPLIGFSWDSFGPMSWHTTLLDLNLKDGR